MSLTIKVGGEGTAKSKSLFRFVKIFKTSYIASRITNLCRRPQGLKFLYFDIKLLFYVVIQNDRGFSYKVKGF